MSRFEYHVPFNQGLYAEVVGLEKKREDMALAHSLRVGLVDLIWGFTLQSLDDKVGMCVYVRVRVCVWGCTAAHRSVVLFGCVALGSWSCMPCG